MGDPVRDYLDRLELFADLPPTLDTLRLLHRRHLDRVPYENLTTMLARPPGARPDASLDRVAAVGRAGYCFHQNGALGLVLARLGFTVTRHHAHVWTDPADRSGRGLNHLALQVSGLPHAGNPGGRWWVDVGLGDAFIDPLPLVAGVHVQEPFSYTLDAVGDAAWSFGHDRHGSFSGLEVRDLPVDQNDVEAAHVELSTPPTGVFTRKLVVQRRLPGETRTLRGLVLTVVDTAGRHETVLSTYPAWSDALTEVLRLPLDGIDGDELRELFRRVRVAHRVWEEAGATVSDLLAIADELYALPLGDFTPARDARVKELKKDDPELSAAVKALRKPSLAAWVVDLLVRRETAQVDQVLQVGAALRDAQESMSADDLRALTKQRRQLTAAVTTRARTLSAEAGQRVTQAVADQVEATLTAAILDAECGRAVRSGLLVTALAATGVDAVDLTAALAVPDALGFVAPARTAPAPVRPDLHVVPDPDAGAKARAAAEEAVDGAQEQLDEAIAAREEAAGALAELEARGMQIQSRLDELRRRIADLEEESEELDDDLADAEEAVAEADGVLSEATAARDRAGQALDRLGG